MNKDTIKVLLINDKNNVLRVEVPVSKKFEYSGYMWAIHRPGEFVQGGKKWVVSEYQTGMRCLVTEGKLADVEEEAKKLLDDRGAERTEKAVELAIERHGITNKEDA